MVRTKPGSTRLFCPGHRRYVPFEMEPGDQPDNPKLRCPQCGYVLTYEQVREGRIEP